MYDEPIYELTEENFSEMQSPAINKLTPKESSSEEKGNKSLFSNSVGRGRKLLVITIEVGNGKQEQLVIHESDNPQMVAEDFCIRHNYNRELKDMLQYQIECTIYEAKSKLIQKERSKAYSFNSGDREFEIPLEVTYSENGMYSKFTPKNDMSTIPNGTYEDGEKESLIANGFLDQNQEEGQQTMRLKDEEEIPEQENEYDSYEANVPESGKKYMEDEDSPMNIETHPRRDPNTIRNIHAKSIAEKYLMMRNQFMPTLTDKTIEMATFKVGTVDPAYNRLHMDALSKKLILEGFKKPQQTKSKLPINMRSDYRPMNPGEVLYQKSRINKEKTSRRAQKQKRQKLEEENKATFKPKINDFEHKYIKRSYKVPISDSLKQEKYKADENNQKLKEELSYHNDQELTFAPQLNKISMEISQRLVKRAATPLEQLSMQSPSKCEKYEKHVTKERESNASMNKTKQ